MLLTLFSHFYVISGADREFSAAVAEYQTHVASGRVAEPHGHAAGLSTDGRGSYITTRILPSIPQHLSCDNHSVLCHICQCAVQVRDSSGWLPVVDHFSSCHSTAHQSCSTVSLCTHFARFRLLFSTCEVTAAFLESLCSFALVPVRTRTPCQWEVTRDHSISDLFKSWTSLQANQVDYCVRREIVIDQVFQMFKTIAEN